MLKKILVSSCLSAMLLNAGSFEFSNIKRNSTGDVVEKGLKVDETKNVIATGYGVNKKQALDNAFKSAIEQYVGVVVDSEIMIKNNLNIKNQILTVSNGFIKTYKELSTNKSDGLVEVKIQATVKSQKVFDKIKSLNITTVTLNNGAQLYAKLSTKIKAKKDAEKLFKKVFGKLFSPDSLQDLLYTKITNVKVMEDKIKDNKVPIYISVEFGIDYQAYIQKMEELEQIFKNLGAKLHKRVDLPYMDDCDKQGDNCRLKIKNEGTVESLTVTDFGIIKKYGQGYKLDVWRFSKTWKDIYPFNTDGDININGYFRIVSELKDKDGKVLSSNSWAATDGYKYILKTAKRCCSNCGNEWIKTDPKIISPFLYYGLEKGYAAMVDADSKREFNIPESIALEDIDKIKDVVVELEQR